MWLIGQNADFVKECKNMYYHGTTRDNADIMVREQFMLPSTGDDQWLGTGYYFYYDIEYAFRWILLKYTNNFKNEYRNSYDKIFDEYSIVSAQIDISDDRVFDMDNIKHHLLFIDTKTKLSEKTAKSLKYYDRLKNQAVVDGVVFNFLFGYTDCKEKYDAVRAVFPISYIFDNSRMDYLPEPQLCIKNADIVSEYQKLLIDKVPDEFKCFITSYNQNKMRLKEKRNLIKYKKSPRSVKYKRKVDVS